MVPTPMWLTKNADFFRLEVISLVVEDGSRKPPTVGAEDRVGFYPYLNMNSTSYSEGLMAIFGDDSHGQELRSRLSKNEAAIIENAAESGGESADKTLSQLAASNHSGALRTIMRSRPARSGYRQQGDARDNTARVSGRKERLPVKNPCTNKSMGRCRQGW